MGFNSAFKGLKIYIKAFMVNSQNSAKFHT